VCDKRLTGSRHTAIRDARYARVRSRDVPEHFEGSLPERIQG
jgi:hypothetical protein